MASEGLSMSEVARRYGHSTTIVSHYIHGRHLPSVENIPGFARAINVELNVLRDRLGLSKVRQSNPNAPEDSVAQLERVLSPLSPREREVVINLASEMANQLRRLRSPS